MSNHLDNPNDAIAFEALDAYLNALHAGHPTDKEELLRKHPELTDALACLDAIDSLVTPTTEQIDGTGQDIHSEPTIVLSTKSAPLGARAGTTQSVPAAKIIGDFELGDEIGRGGMGVVYRAIQRSLDRTVAIKLILTSHLASAEQVDRFYAEARAAARLAHPDIVSVHEVGELHGQHYLVMEYIEGYSLATRIADGPMSPEAAATCVAIVARAVHHLHSAGIVHRDIKPSNILLDSCGRPHLTDFGLAKALGGDSQLTHSGAIVGTPSYMAPEQASARSAEVGPRSDVYSLGAVLYELLTGQPPFRESTPLDTLVQVIEAEPTLPRQLNGKIPGDLELVCLRCLEKVPAARYASADELANDLDRFLGGESVEARPIGVWPQLRRWSRREPALSSHLALLIVCALILQSHYSLRGHRDETPNHYQVMLTLAAWSVFSWLCQRQLNRERMAELVRYVWAAGDVFLFTYVLMTTEVIEGPVVAVYPGLIAASGLWFRERLVRFTAIISVVSYASLLVLLRLRGTELREPFFRHFIFMVVLLAIGAVVAYQVQRIRALSRYYERRRLS